MYRIDLDRISKLEKKYKNSALVSNVLSRLVDTANDGFDVSNLNKNLFNIKMLLDLKILKEEKTNKKKKTSKK